jgi:NAD(P)-dependent dehydrogenase (short-subunit alcohol dehydrogenase family)
VKNKKVLITGGAKGIGLCTAREFAKAGCVLILTDIDSVALQAAEQEFTDHKVPVYTKLVDVTRENEVQDLTQWVLEHVGGLDILINNAGIGHHGELADTTIQKWKQLLDVNLLGPLYHTYAFLPHFKAQKAGHIVNISSGQAFFRLPTWGAYASIKAALGAFSEILHFEMRKYNIHVTTVYPFMVNTPFYDDIHGDTWVGKLSMRLLPYYSMTPEKVARIIFKAVQRKTKIEMVSFFNQIGLYAQFLPFASDIVALISNYFLAKKREAH